MRPTIHRTSLGLLLAAVIAACGGGGALGYAQAPASLDPNSPTVSARDIAFNTSEIDVAANAPFILVFENKDDTDHNISIYTDDSASTRTFDGVVFKLGTRWYPVPALAPGRYYFRCDIHPDMHGHILAA
jgi:plastocyanin